MNVSGGGAVIMRQRTGDVAVCAAQGAHVRADGNASGRLEVRVPIESVPSYKLHEAHGTI